MQWLHWNPCCCHWQLRIPLDVACKHHDQYNFNPAVHRSNDMRMTVWIRFLVLPLAFLATPALADVKTIMTVTNTVPDFRVEVSAEMMCGGTSDNHKKRKNFPSNPIKPDGTSVIGAWKGCQLLASEFYDINRLYKWGRVYVRLKNMKTHDYAVVGIITRASDTPGTETRVISFEGHDIRLDLYHGGYFYWNEYGRIVLNDKITTSLTVSE